MSGEGLPVAVDRMLAETMELRARLAQTELALGEALAARDNARHIAVDQENWAHRLAGALGIALKFVQEPSWAHDADDLLDARRTAEQYSATVMGD